jgi:hypothetical protein
MREIVLEAGKASPNQPKLPEQLDKSGTNEIFPRVSQDNLRLFSQGLVWPHKSALLDLFEQTDDSALDQIEIPTNRVYVAQTMLWYVKARGFDEQGIDALNDRV